jgi:hypothetical protein
MTVPIPSQPKRAVIADFDSDLDTAVRTWRAIDHLGRDAPDKAILADGAALLARIDEMRARLADAMQIATPDDIAREMDNLIGSFPNVAKADLARFGAILCVDVERERPSKIVLARACRELRRTEDFPPTISRVLAAIDGADVRTCHHARVLAEFPYQFERARVAYIRHQNANDRVFARDVADCLARLRAGESAETFSGDVIAVARDLVAPRGANWDWIAPSLKLLAAQRSERRDDDGYEYRTPI